MLNDFINYLKEQIGEPYLWGGQHTKLTPENYIAVVEKKEAKTGGYDDMSYAEAVIKFCKKKFEQGAEVLYAYDCSGLGCYWLYNLKHLFDIDMSANAMMGQCSELIDSEPPEKGWWVFRTDSNGKATHIGYMIDNKTLIEAKGRKYGVVKTDFDDKDWSVWGIPNVFKAEIVDVDPEPTPEPQPTPEPEPVSEKWVEVIGDSVNVRNKDDKSGKVILIAHSKRGWRKKGITHSNDKFRLIEIAPSGWYTIETTVGEGYISNNPKYTKIIEK